MREMFLIIFLACMSGCATLSHLEFDNKENLAKLFEGMSKAKVVEIMGMRNVDIFDVINRRVDNPYKSGIFSTKNRDLEVLYYYIGSNELDGVISDEELMPLVFNRGILIGWDWNFFNYVKRQISPDNG